MHSASPTYCFCRMKFWNQSDPTEYNNIILSIITLTAPNIIELATNSLFSHLIHSFSFHSPTTSTAPRMRDGRPHAVDRSLCENLRARTDCATIRFIRSSIIYDVWASFQECANMEHYFCMRKIVVCCWMIEIDLSSQWCRKNPKIMNYKHLNKFQQVVRLKIPSKSQDTRVLRDASNRKVWQMGEERRLITGSGWLRAKMMILSELVIKNKCEDYWSKCFFLTLPVRFTKYDGM